MPYHSGTWKNLTFKKYNFDAEGAPTNGGALHPLLKVREEIRDIFLEMGCVLVLLTSIVLHLFLSKFRRDADVFIC